MIAALLSTAPPRFSVASEFLLASRSTLRWLCLPGSGLTSPQAQQSGFQPLYPPFPVTTPSSVPLLLHRPLLPGACHAVPCSSHRDHQGSVPASSPYEFLPDQPFGFQTFSCRPSALESFRIEDFITLVISPSSRVTHKLLGEKDYSSSLSRPTFLLCYGIGAPSTFVETVQEQANDIINSKGVALGSVLSVVPLRAQKFGAPCGRASTTLCMPFSAPSLLAQPPPSSGAPGPLVEV